MRDHLREGFQLRMVNDDNGHIRRLERASAGFHDANGRRRDRRDFGIARTIARLVDRNDASDRAIKPDFERTVAREKAGHAREAHAEIFSELGLAIDERLK